MKTLLIGNGINRFLSPKVLSWEMLVNSLWAFYKSNPPPKFPDGVSNTEIMELLFLKKQGTDKENPRNGVKKRICSLTEEWTSEASKINDKKTELIKGIGNKFKHIITTNYDDILPTILEFKFYKNHSALFTDFYPWTSYYSEFKNPKTKIWYIHGTNQYFRSIRISLNDYHNAIQQARSLLSNRWANKKKNPQNDYYESSLIKIFLEEDLIICGLSLASDELFLRWLLFQKAGKFKKAKATYFHVKNKEDENIRFLFENLGYKTKSFTSYEALYSELSKL